MAGEESVFIAHKDCEKCGSSDANSVYSDGHEFCFSCGYHKPGSGENSGEPRKQRHVAGLLPYSSLTLRAIQSRKLTEDTCRRFGYRIGEYQGKACQVAPYFDADGNLIAQHLRTADKKFPWRGSPKEALPFGAHVWPKKGKKIVVTEGEVDAMSMSQAQGNKYPVVSIGCGAGPQIKKYFAERLAYFNSFDEVVIMFDNDEAGHQASKDAAEVLGPRALIAELPLKDASEMLVQGRTEELINAMWKAKRHRPDGIVTIEEIREEAMIVPEFGLSYPWQTLTDWTYGIRPHQLIALGAGVGVGKTDFYTTIATHLIVKHEEKVGMFYMEQKPTETATRMAGKIAGKPLHIPAAKGGWSNEERDAAWDKLQHGGKLFLYDSFGNNEWAPIKEKIEYLHYAEGVNYFFLDHLTALAAWQDDERKTLEIITSEMGGMVQKMPITIFFVSHLATPDGKPHEEGGRVMARHLKGSRSIIQWATFIIGLERDQQAESEIIRSTTTVRCLKDRFAGSANGRTYFLRYDAPTGLLNEVSYEDVAEARSTGMDEDESEAGRINL